jgi:hypothetical protein
MDKKDFQEKLKTDFPTIFSSPPSFNLGDGWSDIIYALSKELSELSFSKNLSLEVLRIKEKFGGLTCHIGGDYTSEVGNIVSKYHNQSLSTCECCGENAKQVVLNYWVKTLCKNCFNKIEQHKLFFKHGDFYEDKRIN